MADDLTIWRAQGVSMGPAWGPDALLGVRPLNPSAPPSLGDVIVYELAGGVLAHRVVGRRRTPEGRVYITQGDARWRPDQLSVPESAVRGVVVRVSLSAMEFRLDGWRGTVEKKLRWGWLRIKTLLARGREVFRAT